MFSIQQASIEYYPEWDQFVSEHNEATFFHRYGWKKVIEKSFGHRCFYLYATTNNKIVGILPLAEVKSLLFGHSLSSLPFAVYGGVLANNKEIQQALINYACNLATKIQVDYLELRNKNRQNPDWECKTLYVHFKKNLHNNDEENLKEIPRKQRAMVRKAIKGQLVCEKHIPSLQQENFKHSLKDFYQLYSESVRNLGTPVFSMKYFENLYKIFSQDMDILTIKKEGENIASVLSFYHKNEVLPYYGGGSYLARTYKGNDFMYWSLMQHVVKKGIKSFDYGRSKKNTGSYSFKKNWGFTPQPLYYEYFLVKAKQMPDINPLNPKYQIFIFLWKKLPLKISQLLGPLLSRSLG